MTLNEQNYFNLLNSLSDSVFVHQNGKILFGNSAAYSILGYTSEEAVGTSLFQFIVSEEDKILVQQNMQKRYNKEDIPDYEIRIRDKRGRIHTVIVRASLTTFNGQEAIQVVLIDVTEYNKTKTQLLNAGKLEALGLLAGGIAHEFNNVLAGITTGLSYIKLFNEENKEVLVTIEDMENIAFRARELTHQLLAYSRGDTPVKEGVAIKEIIEESIQLSVTKSDIECILRIPDSIPYIMADRLQLRQVFNNIIINAVQATQGEGILVIKAKKVIIAKTSPQMQQGEYIKISIADNGIGILKEHIDKIFDPFFSTKDEGYGFGLAITNSIIQRHNGYIFVNSRVNKGTLFTIYFPLFQDQTSLKSPLQITRKNQRILIMDDERVIRIMLEKILPNFGYDTVSVEDGQTAFDVYKNAYNSDAPFSLVILDLIINDGVGGVETLNKLLQFDDSVKAIAMSGYVNDPVLTKAKKYGFIGSIRKPFQIDELRKAIDDAIEK